MKITERKKALTKPSILIREQ